MNIFNPTEQQKADGEQKAVEEHHELQYTVQ